MPLPAASGSPLALLACLSVLPVLAMAHDGTRLLQVLILTLSAWLWLAWPLQNHASRAWQASAAWCVGCLFLLDAVVRGFILQTYGARPDSTMVMNALANTHSGESAEFLLAYWPGLLKWSVLLMLSAAVLGILLRRWWKTAAIIRPMTRWRRAAFVVLLLLLVTALTIKPWRKYHPVVFWSLWTEQLAETRAQWHRAHLHRAGLKQRAAAQAPALTSSSPDTLVLVISESINRDHLSLYGYPRPTTPKLNARLKEERHAFKFFRHSWSADASTVAALNNFFFFGEPANPSRNHLLAIAAAAGYKTWWISNHDDLAIHNQHAQLAEQQQMLNDVPGRSASSLDQSVLPPLEKALRGGDGRKLIVVHLLGAHPHYRLRHPPGLAPFDDAKDHVYQQMEASGRSYWTRELRNEYDSAIHYHDSVVDRTLELTRKLGRRAGWIFLSDHGQEVGSLSDHAGHSASSADGYRIPLLVWGTAAHGVSEELRLLPLRADWLGHSVTRWLGIDWKGYRSERDILHPDYHWTPPPHPIRVDYLS